MDRLSDRKSDILYQYRNCRILRNGQIFKEDLWIRNGQIMNPEILFYVEQVKADQQIDCCNLIIAPGFIDVQINGAFGYDFSQENIDVEKAIKTVGAGLLAHGVTSFCPTLITSHPSVYHKALPCIKKCNGTKERAGVLGAHVEGPFISQEMKGAHPSNLIQDIEHGFEDVQRIYGHLDNIALVTIAPEKANIKGVIEEFCRRGITVSVGHSVANLLQGEEAIRNGARFITHLFNAMLPFHHRDPHLVGLLTSEEFPKNRKVFYGLISDGIHTHPTALRIAYRVHPDGLVLVTDAMPAMGLPPGDYSFGEQMVTIKDNKATLKGKDTLAGSIASLDECVRHFLTHTGCDPVFALECASLHPAQMLGIDDRKGTLNFDSDADFIMLDDSFHVKKTFIAGELVYEVPHNTK